MQDYACSAKPTIALCMYGLVRNADVTPTLQRHVYRPLRSLGGTDLFLHTLLAARVGNPRSGEDRALHPTEFLKLGPLCRFTAEDQAGVDARELLNSSMLRDYLHNLSTLLPRKHHSASFDPRHGGYDVATYRNWMRGMYSMQRVAQLAIAHEEEGGFRYRLVASVRPDTAFLTELPRQELTFLLQATRAREVERMVLVADMHHWFGVNDRFAVGTRDAMFDVHMDRLKPLKEQIQSGLAGTSEAMLCRLLRANRVRVLLADICVVRVRATGECSSLEFTQNGKGGVVCPADYQLVVSVPGVNRTGSTSSTWPCRRKGRSIANTGLKHELLTTCAPGRVSA